MFLDKRLEAWLQTGIISAEQRDRIRDFEKTRTESYVFRGFLALGIITVAIGVVSLVAFNWDRIEPGTKLALGFGLLILASAFVFSMELQSSMRPYSGLGVLFLSLLVLGMIGLISQTYNRQGESYEALFLWSALVGGAVCFYGNRASVHIFFSLLSFALFDWLDSFSGSESSNFLALFALAPAVLLSVGLACARLNQFEHLRNAAFLWCALYFVGGTCFASFLHGKQDLALDEEYKGLLALLALAPVWISEARIRTKSYLSAVLILHVVFLRPELVPLFGDVTSALLFLVLWGLAALLFSTLERPRLFDTFLAGMGLRFLVVYFQVFGSLAATGLGLIFSGLLIIACAILFFRYKQKLGNWIGSLQ